MESDLPHWVVVTVKEIRTPGSINRKEFDIVATIVQIQSRVDVVRKFAPDFIEACEVPSKALDKLDIVEDTLHTLVTCRDSTGRGRLQIRTDVRKVLEHLFDQFRSS